MANTINEDFNTNFLNIKLFFFLLLLVVSIVNKDLEFLNSHKKEFIIECFIVGVLSIIPMLYIQHKRIGFKNTTTDQKYKLLLWFVLMIYINVGLELSGMYEILYPNKIQVNGEKIDFSFFYNVKKEEQKISSTLKVKDKVGKYFQELDNTQNKNKKIIRGMSKGLFITIGIIIGVIILYLIYLSIKIKDFDIPKYENNKVNLLLIETIIFSLGNTLPLLLIVYNRQQNNRKNLLKRIYPELLLLSGKMALLHIILQASGFYSDMFDW